ncbi:MAG: hypothetical protein U0232_18510 [Thermomicrobiales bacterium]
MSSSRVGDEAVPVTKEASSEARKGSGAGDFVGAADAAEGMRAAGWLLRRRGRPAAQSMGVSGRGARQVTRRPWAP